MAYFSNGSEGRQYEDRFCSRCVHWRLDKKTDTQGCAIFDAHLAYNGDQHKNEAVAGLLGFLIPRSKDGLSNLQCRLFVTAEDVKRIRQERADAAQAKLPI